MKKIIYTSLFAILISSCEDSSEKSMEDKMPELNELNLSGHIKKDIDWIYLEQFNGEKWTKTDSSKVKNGDFNFHKSFNAPEMIHLSYNEDRHILFFAENGEVPITINENNSLEKASGSKNHDEWALIQNQLSRYEYKMDSLYELYYVFKEKQDTIKLNNIELLYDETEENKSEYILDYIKSNPKSYVSAYLFGSNYYYSNDEEELSSLLAQFNENGIESNHLTLITNRLKDLEKTAIGSAITEFQLPDINGNIVNINNFKGQYVLIDFWASWCGPCRQENPNVVKAFENYKTNNFTVLGISLDKDKEKWLKAIAKDKLDWTHVSDLNGWDNSVAKQFGVKSIPFSILIDPTGKIIAKDLRGEKLIEFLNNNLK